MKRFDEIERAIAREEDKLGLSPSSQIEVWDDRIDRIWAAKARHGLS
jgi:hypothetical protein